MIVDKPNDPETIDPSSEQIPPLRPGFGFWSTTGLGILVILINIAVTIVITIIYLVFTITTNIDEDPVQLTLDMMSDGLFLSIVTIATAICCCAAIALFVYMKKGITIKHYLGFTRISKKWIFGSLGITILYIVISEVVLRLISGGESSTWMEDVYLSSGWVPLLVLAFVVFGPAFEEMLFRGFLFEGFRYVKFIRLPGTIILTSLLWASLHIQYGIYGIIDIFVIGLIFGYVRYKSGSIWIPYIMHAFNNLLAVIQAGLLVNGILN